MTSAVEAVRALYEVHGAGGALHVAVDDWNIADDEVRFCEAGISDEVERVAYEALISLTERERATVLAIHDEMYEPVG